MAEHELNGVSVVTFESRRSSEMATLIRKRGGVAISAPSMREVPISDERVAHHFTKQLLAGHYDGLVMLSGGGTRKLLESACRVASAPQVTEALRSIWLICRGPKPTHVLRELGLKATLVAPEPNTTRELIRELDIKLNLKGARLAVQEYGESNIELLHALEARGATTTPLLVYEWKLPLDMAPLQGAIRYLCDGTAAAALFTSARQVVHAFQVARMLGLEDPLRQALKERVVASIGPVTTAALNDFGVIPDAEPEHPKMGLLVSHLARNWTLLSNG